MKETEQQVIVLGGKEYKLSPLNLKVLSTLEQEFNCEVDKIGELLNTRRATALMTLCYALLKGNYPKLTKEKIGEMITIKDFEKVGKAVSKALAGE